MTKKQKSEILIGLYQNRFKQLRLGQECYKKGDQAKSIEHYSNYLSILAQYFGTQENNLNPKFFDQKKDIGELLLISNVYWNLAKTYDKIPKFKYQLKRCLEQFLEFTHGYKHQHANARMLKNYINSGRPRNKKEFRRIYEKIKHHSSACFIATHCFGCDSPVTEQLRILRRDISGSFPGDSFIGFYYKYAPSLINFFDHHEKVQKTALPPIKIFLIIVAWFHQKLR